MVILDSLGQQTEVPSLLVSEAETQSSLAKGCAKSHMTARGESHDSTWRVT